MKTINYLTNLFSKLKRTYVLTDYLLFCVTIFASIIILSIITSVVKYKSTSESNKQKLQIESIEIEKAIERILNEYFWQLQFLAQKISGSAYDLDKINKIFQNSAKLGIIFNEQKVLSCQDLYWVGVDNNILVSSKIGVLQHSKPIPYFYEIERAKKESWKPIISDNVPYLFNDYSLLPAILGITGQNGKYLGAIASSIEVDSIKNLLINNLAYTYSENFIILNSKNNSIIFQSGEARIRNPAFFTHKIGNIEYEKSPSGYLAKQNIEHDGIRYLYYKKFDNYPFVILAGYNKGLHNSQLFYSISKIVILHLVVGVILILTLSLLYRRVVKPIKELAIYIKDSNQDNQSRINKYLTKYYSPEIYSLTRTLIRIRSQKMVIEEANSELMLIKHKLEQALKAIETSEVASKEIVWQIRQEVNKNIRSAFQIINLLQHSLPQENKNGVTRINEELIAMLSKEINNIYRFSTDELNKTLTEVSFIIDQAVSLQSKELAAKNIELKIVYSKSTPRKFLLDRVRILQVLCGVLHKTINFLVEDNKLEIEVRNYTHNKVKYLGIKIQDNGIGLSIKSFTEQAKKFGSPEESTSGIDLPLSTIEELVKLHGGEIEYKEEMQKGAATIIKLPYKKEKEKELESDKKEAGPDNNIVYIKDFLKK